VNSLFDGFVAEEVNDYFWPGTAVCELRKMSGETGEAHDELITLLG
jgi:hypothetical protein